MSILSSGNLSRTGNALVIALGILVMISAAIAVSTTRGTAVLQESSGLRFQASTVGAVEAALARQEMNVISLAEAGDPNAFAAITRNYNSELFGNCEVRTKIEPVRTATKDVDGNPIAFITNPSPEISWEAPADDVRDAVGRNYPIPGNPAARAVDASDNPYWKTNDSVYLYRISAEARYFSESPVAAERSYYGDTRTTAEYDWNVPGTWKARAQGVRYVAVNKEPLFRYVIFYAQQGPKGDLELSHGPAINIQGNVHSNGSIYMGAGTEVNRWDAVRPNNGNTQLGPDPWSATVTYSTGARVSYLSGSTRYYTYINASPATGKLVTDTAYWEEKKEGRVRVTGVDGIFRLCKPLLYGRFNFFPIAAPTGIPAWTPLSGAPNDTDDYNIALTGTPLDGYDGTASNILARTFSGGWVNPYRVRRSSLLSTRPIADSTTDDVRRINGVPLVGYGSTTDASNDSRDFERSDARKWPVLALAAPPDGFAGFARNRAVGGRVKKLDETLISRPLEAQQVFYPDVNLMDRILGRIPNQTLVTAADKANPPLIPYLAGVLEGTTLSQGIASMQPFFNAYRERGDDHSRAAPRFMDIATQNVGSTPTEYEVPGQYIRYVLDGVGANDWLMKRTIDPDQGFIGWTVTDAAGAPVGVSPKVGLMIRERPVPDFDYWGITPTGTYFNDRPYGHRDYQPWAYGKHKDTAVWPFTELYVSGTHTNNRLPAVYPPTSNAILPDTDPNYAALVSTVNSNRLTNPNSSTQSYVLDPLNPGHIVVTAAVRKGGDGIDPTGSDGWDVRADDNGYFRDNWRFIHLKRKNVTSSVGPVVNMTAADTYFDGGTFQAVQTRIQPNVTTNALISGSNDQRVAGLMIRPVNSAATGMSATTNLGGSGSGKALNGRDPFVALVVSPHRGIILQRRLEPSRMQWIAVPTFKRYYTGTDDGSGTESAGLGCINSPNLAVLSQTDRVQAVNATYDGGNAYNSGIIRVPSPSGYNNWQEVNGASTFSKTLTKAQGEGSVSQSFTFTKGPWINRWRWQAYKYWSKQNYRNRLTPAVNGYIDLSVTGAGPGGLVDFFTSMTTAPGNLGWTNGWSGRTMWLSTAWPGGSGADPTGGATMTLQNLINPALPGEPGQGFIDHDTHRWRYMPQNAGQLWSGANTNYSSVQINTTTQNSLGAATDVFRTAAFTSAVAFLGSEAAVISALSGNGINAAIDLATVPNPPAATGEPNDPTEPAAPAPPGLPGAIVQPDFGAAGTMTFAVTRDNQPSMAQPIEYNSWISARGTWFNPATQRFQDVSGNSSDRITPWSPYPIDNLYSPTISDPGTSSSLRPDYWTGAAKATPSWTDMYSPSDAVDGSIVPGTTGYVAAAQLNSGAGTSQRLWEDAQMPYWANGTAYVAENDGSLTRASVVIYNGVFYACLANHTATATTPPSAPALWQRADQVWLRMAKIGSELAFYWFVGTTPPAASDWRWREVTEARARRPDGSAADPGAGNVAARVTIPAAWSNTWMVGPCLQSGDQNSTATAEFSNLQVEDSAETSALSPGKWDWQDWEAGVETVRNPVDQSKLLGRVVDNVTKYLCSQYQVFWGPLDITEDFFSYSTDNTGASNRRLATEDWFYNPREFWSQSAWWNEGDLTTSWTAEPRGNWIYKETGTTTAPAALPNGVGISWVEYASRVNVLNLNLGNLQTYLMNRTLDQAAYRWSEDTSQGIPVTVVTMRDGFSGTVYAARTNRYPRNPLPDQANPWNPELPNTTLNGSMVRPIALADLFGDQPAAPSTLQEATRKRLIPDDAGNRPPLAPPLRNDGFLNAVMISNGNTINWGYRSPAVFGQSNTSIVTPNTLYVYGDLNNNMQTVREKASSPTTKSKYTPLAIMGDSVTLLSGSWSFANYQRPGLAVSTSKVSSWNASTLSQLNGASAASVTSYRTCILTNNQPTTKYRVFMGEGAPFINTMQFIEDWNGKTMNFTGSLVVLDSCRYTRSFLLQEARTYGRSPFGIMGWHAEPGWNTITGWAGGTNVYDWCQIGGVAQPTVGNSNNASNPFGSPNVYRPPTRNMTFNDDLLKEEGTPPNTPFGVTASGVAGWTRVLR